MAAFAGLYLDPWQELALGEALGEVVSDTGAVRWASRQVGLVVPRQNGKNSILEARELAGLFVFGERLQVHTAHVFDTAIEAFDRIAALVRNNPTLWAKVKSINASHGHEGIELHSGQRLRFKARTSGGGRGFTGDAVYLDEAMYLSEATMSALLPTLSARPNPQVWFTGSAVDQRIHPEGHVLTRIRNRALDSINPAKSYVDDILCYLEWSAAGTIEVDPKDPDNTGHNPLDRSLWWDANPGMGIRITEAQTEAERLVLSPRGFATERLGIGDWPEVEVEASLFDLARWRNRGVDALAPVAETTGRPSLAVETSLDGARTSIALVRRRIIDGGRQVEIIDQRRGSAWVAERIAELVAKWNPCALVIDSGGPSGPLLHPIEMLLQKRRLSVEIVKATARELVQACGEFHTAVQEDEADDALGALWHLNDPDLTAAVAKAKKRVLASGAWAFDRMSYSTDMAPLLAASLALLGFTMFGAPATSIYEERGFIVL